MALVLALYLAAFSGRPLAVTLLYGVRTFLPPLTTAEAVAMASDCLACFGSDCILPARPAIASSQAQRAIASLAGVAADPDYLAASVDGTGGGRLHMLRSRLDSDRVAGC